MRMTIGFYDQEIVAALAYDLAARALSKDHSDYNFSDDMLHDLVPIYGADVLDGLGKNLPQWLQDSIHRHMQSLA